MPTFQNDHASANYLVKNISGDTVNVAPGETVESYEMLDRLCDGMTKTSDRPLLDYMERSETITFSGAETKIITLTDTEILESNRAVIHIYGSGLTVSIKLNSVENRLHRLLSVDDGFVGVEIDLAKNVEKIYLTSNAAGTARVYFEG